MNRIQKGILVAILFYYVYGNYFTTGMIRGIYISNSKEALADGPSFGDTLQLSEDNRFSSTTWGEGAYQLHYSLYGTDLELNYKDEFEAGSYQTDFYRTFLGKPKITIDTDLEYYFEKID